MNDTPQKYFIYARKSTDDPKRQIRSIDDQLAELRDLAKKENLDVVREFREHRTAKVPGRPIFNEMLGRIEKGEASGILAWHPDRLSRNSVDAGRIIWLVDTEVIKALRFPMQWFEPTAQGKFSLSLMLSQSKYYVDSMGENIKRGLGRKAISGVWPQLAPLGYMNDTRSKNIIRDPDKAPLVQAAFNLYATGNHTLAEVQKQINALGLTGRNGGPLSISNYQLLLTNPLYYGVFRYRGEFYEGKHEPLISKKLFDKVRAVMSAKSKPKTSGLKPYLYRGVFRCGECGCFITTETQKGHNYLHCTKRVKKDCSQPYVREERISEQITDFFAHTGIPSGDGDEMIVTLEAERDGDCRACQESTGTLRTRLLEVEDKLKRLMEAYLGQVVSLDEYRAAKADLLGQKQQVKGEIAVMEKNRSSWFEPAIRFVKDLKEATFLVENGSEEQKRDFLKKVGSNLTISDRHLSVKPRQAWELVVDQGRFAQHNAAAEISGAAFLGKSNHHLNKSG